MKFKVAQTKEYKNTKNVNLHKSAVQLLHRDKRPPRSILYFIVIKYNV